MARCAIWRDWKVAAAYVDEVQRRSIYDGAIQVLSRPGLVVGTTVAAGIGWPLVAAISGEPHGHHHNLWQADRRP